MNLRKIISRFAASPEDPGELRRVARTLGNELPRGRLSVLRGFRAEIGRVRRPAPQAECRADYASGYVACMLDVTAEFEVALGQQEDEAEIRRTAQEQGWRDVFALLSDGPMLPSTIADRLNVDRSSVSRLLSRMRAAGVVETAPGDVLDGRTRPHRMTLAGRRLMQQLEPALPREMRLGIEVAVALIGHMMRHESSAEHELRALAQELLGGPEVANHAVEAWTDASAEYGLLRDNVRAINDQRGGGHGDVASASVEQPQVASNAPWTRVPRVLARMPASPQSGDVPLYVRTTDDAWPAWAFALTQEPGHRQSRTIVDGDLLTRSIQLPEQPYRLVYDHPSAISSDAENPHMREFMARADEKFVVAYSDTELGDVPGDFIPIPMSRLATEGEHA